MSVCACACLCTCEEGGVLGGWVALEGWCSDAEDGGGMEGGWWG